MHPPTPTNSFGTPKIVCTAVGVTLAPQFIYFWLSSFTKKMPARLSRPSTGLFLDDVMPTSASIRVVSSTAFGLVFGPQCALGCLSAHLWTSAAIFSSQQVSWLVCNDGMPPSVEPPTLGEYSLAPYPVVSSTAVGLVFGPQCALG